MRASITKERLAEIETLCADPNFYPASSGLKGICDELIAALRESQQRAESLQAINRMHEGWRGKICEEVDRNEVHHVKTINQLHRQRDEYAALAKVLRKALISAQADVRAGINPDWGAIDIMPAEALVQEGKA